MWQAQVYQLIDDAKQRAIDALGGSGSLAGLPNASSKPEGYEYFASNDAGGRLWKIVSGAWAAVAPAVFDQGGQELAYAECTTTFSTASTTGADIPGLSFTVQGNNKPMALLFSCRGSVNATLNGGVVVQMLDGASPIGQVDNLQAPAGYRVGLERTIRVAPFTGPKTFKAQLLCLSGTAQIVATGAGSQAFLQAISR